MVGLRGEADAIEIVEGPRGRVAETVPRAEVERQHRVLERRQRGQQLEELEDDAHVLAAPHGQLLFVHLVE